MIARASLLRQLRSEIQHVDVGSEPHVVGQVIAVVVWIFVDNDVVAIPKPVVAESEVIGSNAEIEASEPEAVGAAAAEMPAVVAAESAGKASVLPGMIDVVVEIVAARIVADPLAVGVDVGSIGMSGFVVEMTVLLNRVRSAHGRGTVGGNVSTAADSTMLREGGEGKQQAECE